MTDAPFIDYPDSPHFTVVVLPDTQHYARCHPETLEAQTRWIADQQNDENIAFVVHEGDHVTEPDPEQLNRADQAMRRLDENDIPYLIAIGNHDYDDVAERRASTFEEYFPESRFAGQPWWGGSYDGTAYNAYACFEALDNKYLVLTLELFPREEVVEWAAEQLDSHPDHRALLVTHGYLYCDGTHIDVNDRWDRTVYDLTGHNGDELWERFVSRRENIRVVLCGHVLCEDGAQLTQPDKNGDPIHQLLANYQSIEGGGKGYLRLLRFFPRDGTITVETYSPFLNKYHEDENQYFCLNIT